MYVQISLCNPPAQQSSLGLDVPETINMANAFRKNQMKVLWTQGRVHAHMSDRSIDVYHLNPSGVFIYLFLV